MSATAEVNELPKRESEPVSMIEGGHMIVRGAQSLLGTGLALAAVGLWFAPGANTESDIVLFKLVLSISAGLAGMGLLHASATPRSPEIEIDTIRRQVRVVRRQPGGVPKVLQSCSFAQLGAAEYEGSMVRLWDQAGVLLAEVNLSDRNALSSLVAGLRDEGKLA